MTRPAITIGTFSLECGFNKPFRCRFLTVSTPIFQLNAYFEAFVKLYKIIGTSFQVFASVQGFCTLLIFVSTHAQQISEKATLPARREKEDVTDLERKQMFAETSPKFPQSSISVSEFIAIPGMLITCVACPLHYA